MPATTAYGYDLELALGIGRQGSAGRWDQGRWDTTVWAQTDTSLGDWVDVTCDVVSPFTLAAGSSEDQGVTLRWEAASCAFTLAGPTWDPWNGPYADLLGPEIPVRWRWRLTPGPPPPNVGPVAAFTHAETDQTTTVNGSGSHDPDGTIVSWAWTFGDGATGTGVTASHTYTAGGTYTVRLTVTDDDGATHSVTHPVTVAAPPVAPPSAGRLQWLRAKDLGAAGSTITLWPDQSGLGHNAGVSGSATVAAAATPAGGKAARLNGASVTFPPYLTTGPAELWGVLKGDNSGRFWQFGNSGSACHYTFSGAVYDDFGATVRDSFTPTVNVGSAYRIIHVSIAADGTKIWEIDNVEQFRVTRTIGWDGGPHGLSNAWVGDWVEVMVRDRVSTPAEKTQMLAYLNGEHGLSVPLSQTRAARAVGDDWTPLFYGATIDAGWDWDPASGTAQVTASDATADLATFVGVKQAVVGAGETGAARVTRWLDYARWPADRRAVTAGGMALVATDMAGKAWESLLDVADTDVALLFVDRAGRLVYKPMGRTQVTVVAGALVACPTPAFPAGVQVVDMGRGAPAPVVNIVSVRGGTPPGGQDPAYATFTDEGSVTRYRAHRAGYDLLHDTTAAPTWSQTVAQLVGAAQAWPSTAPHELTLGLVAGDLRVPGVLFQLDPGQAFQVVDTGGRVWLEQVAGWEVQVGWDTCGGHLYVTDVTRWAGAWWDTATWDHSHWTL